MNDPKPTQEDIEQFVESLKRQLTLAIEGNIKLVESYRAEKRRADALEEALRKWVKMPSQEMRLHCSELTARDLTARELRTTRAVLWKIIESQPTKQ